MPHREDHKKRKQPQRRTQASSPFTNPFLLSEFSDFVTPAASNFAAPGITTLGGANTIPSLPGISGAATTGGPAGAGLGGAGAGASTGFAGLGAGTLALPLLVPALGAALNDGGNKLAQLQAIRDIKEGKAERGPLDLRITRRDGAEFVGGDPNAIDRAVELAAERGIGATKINPVLASFNANRENVRQHLQAVERRPDRFKDAKNRAVARAAQNARQVGHRVSAANVTNKRGGVRHAFRPENIARRRAQGGR